MHGTNTSVNHTLPGAFPKSIWPEMHHIDDPQLAGMSHFPQLFFIKAPALVKNYAGGSLGGRSGLDGGMVSKPF